MTNKFFSTIALLSLLFLLLSKKIGAINKLLSERKIENINSNWKYLENNLTDIKELKNQKEWQPSNFFKIRNP